MIDDATSSAAVDMPLPDAFGGPRHSKKRPQSSRRKSIPYIAQLESADCGAACLAMVLHHFGHEVSLGEVRDRVAVDRSGVSARNILDGADHYGLLGRAVRLEMEHLSDLPRASILHWQFQHFVVFDRLNKNSVSIIDPAFGRRDVPLAQFSDAFTGVALSFEPKETFELRSAGASPVRRYLLELLEHREVLARVLILSAIIQVVALAVPVATGVMIDRVIPRGDLYLLWVVVAGLGMMGVFRALVGVLRSHMLLYLRSRLDTKLTLGFVSHLVALPYAFFLRRSTGDLLLRVSSNAIIREVLTSNAISALLDGVLVNIYLGLALVVSPWMALLMLLLGGVRVAIFLVMRSRFEELNAQELEVRARSQSYLTQALGGIETLKAAGSEQRAVEKWSNLFAQELNVSLDEARLTIIVRAALDFLSSSLAPLLILGFGAFLVLRGDLSLGTMLAVNALALAFLDALASLVDSALDLTQLRGHAERMNDVLSTPIERHDAHVQSCGRLQGNIAVDDVSFSYGPAFPLAVHGASLEIRRGESVALVGPSGSGKSTLARLLLGLYEPTSGKILYDGRDLRNLELRSLRKQLGIVPQNPYFFDVSIRENIALGHPAARFEHIVEAARLASIHDDIMAMPARYETLLADRGESLSGGQRQRIALARALLHRPAILLLDEATSALDTETERNIVTNLNQLRCTRIIIAHRLSTIRSADVIVVMEGGRVVDTGTHSELMRRSGVYQRLVQAQSGAQSPDEEEAQKIGAGALLSREGISA